MMGATENILVVLATIISTQQSHCLGPQLRIGLGTGLGQVGIQIVDNIIHLLSQLSECLMYHDQVEVANGSTVLVAAGCVMSAWCDLGNSGAAVDWCGWYRPGSDRC